MDEGVHYTVKYYSPCTKSGVFTCLRCGRRFPTEYSKKRHTSCRGRNLLSVYAWNNFKAHLCACWARK